MKIVALLINLFIPGIGSMLIGKGWQGTFQLLLYLFGLLTSFIGIGFIFIAIAWIWGLVTVVTFQDQPIEVIVRNQ